MIVGDAPRCFSGENMASISLFVSFEEISPIEGFSSDKCGFEDLSIWDNSTNSPPIDRIFDRMISFSFAQLVFKARQQLFGVQNGVYGNRKPKTDGNHRRESQTQN